MGDKYPYYLIVTFGLNENYVILDTAPDGKYQFSEGNVYEHTDFAFAHLEDAVNEVKRVAKAYPDFVQIVVENAKEHKWERIFEQKDGKIICTYKLGKYAEDSRGRHRQLYLAYKTRHSSRRPN